MFRVVTGSQFCWLTLVSRPFGGQADTAWPKAPNISQVVGIDYLRWPKLQVNKNTLIRQVIPRPYKLPPMSQAKPSLECAGFGSSRPAESTLYFTDLTKGLEVFILLVIA